MGQPEGERKAEGHSGAAKLLTFVVSSFLAGGGVGNVIGGINWAKETKTNGENLATLKAQFEEHRITTRDQFGRTDRKLDGIDSMLARIWADLQQRNKGGEP